MTEYIHSEAGLAEEKGVALAEVRRRRTEALIEGEDWMLVDGDVMLTTDAMVFLFGASDEPEGVEEPAGTETSPGVVSPPVDDVSTEDSQKNAPPPGPDPDGLAPEAALAERLGVKRARLRRMRKDCRLDAEKGPDGSIHLSWPVVVAITGAMGIAVDFAREAFRAAREDKKPAADAKAEASSSGPPVEGVAEVVQTRLKNRHTLLAEIEKQRLTVRVRDNGAFRVGMKIPVKRISGNFYEFAGRMPKSHRSYF